MVAGIFEPSAGLMRSPAGSEGVPARRGKVRTRAGRVSTRNAVAFVSQPPALRCTQRTPAPDGRVKMSTPVSMPTDLSGRSRAEPPFFASINRPRHLPYPASFWHDFCNSLTEWQFVTHSLNACAAPHGARVAGIFVRRHHANRGAVSQGGTEPDPPGLCFRRWRDDLRVVHN